MIDADTLAEAGRGGHSVFAPSASAMWLTCPGSLLPHLASPDTAGFDAAQGTVAHGLAAQWFTEGEPHHLIGTHEVVEAGGEDHEVSITAEMMGYVGEYVAWCRELPGTHMVEQRVTFSEYMPIPDQGGTADHLSLMPRHLTITDFKYGFIRVPATTPQIKLYALGAFLEWDWLYAFERITLRIGQPRIGHFDVIEMTREELLDFGEYVRERAALCLEPDAPRAPSPSGCRWCNVRPTCPAFAGVLDRLADDTFEYEAAARDMITTKQTLEAGRPRPETPPPHEMATEHLARVLSYRSLMESWFGQVFEELRRRAGDGEAIPGWKIVPGRSSRAWVGPGAGWRLARAAHLPLDDLMVPPALLSPHQAGKVLRAAGFKPAEIERMMNALVRVTPGPRTLVPEGDTRDAVLPVADETFSYGDI